MIKIKICQSCLDFFQRVVYCQSENLYVLIAKVNDVKVRSEIKEFQLTSLFIHEGRIITIVLYNYIFYQWSAAFKKQVSLLVSPIFEVQWYANFVWCHAHPTLPKVLLLIKTKAFIAFVVVVLSLSLSLSPSPFLRTVFIDFFPLALLITLIQLCGFF